MKSQMPKMRTQKALVPKVFSAFSFALISLISYFLFPSILHTTPYIPTASAAAPTNGLVGYWNFDEGSGNTAADSSGNGNTGTLVNGPVWTTGKVGSGALSFDGVNDYVDISNSQTLNPINGVTVSAWVKANTWVSDGGIFAKGPNANRQYWLWVSSGKIEYSVGGSGSVVTGITAPSIGTWNHFVLTFDNNIANLYLNGTLIHSINPGGTLSANSTGFSIGKLNGFNYFDGQIDEVRVYNRVLSSQEVLDIYNDAGTPPAGGQDITPPSTPTNLSATAVSSSQINLSWSPSTDPSVAGQVTSGVAGYKIYRNGTQIGTFVSTSYQDSNLQPQTSYSYTVSAYDAAGNGSSQSSITSATTKAISSGPRTFYIASNGSDSNDGISKTTPLLHAPGMNGCVAVCASIVPVAGDSFILRGGDTWHNSASGQTPGGLLWLWTWSGTLNNPIYIGVDISWYNSSVCGGSFCRPVLNSDGQVVPGTAQRGYNVMFDLDNTSYLQIDNIEFFNFYWNSSSGNLWGSNIMLKAINLNHNLRVTNSYFHKWAHSAFGVGGVDDYAVALKGDSHTDCCTDNSVENSTFGSSDPNESDKTSFIAHMYGFRDIHGIHCQNIANCVITNNNEKFYNNIIENIYASSGTTHSNGYESNTDTAGMQVHNNIFRHIGVGVVKLWISPTSNTYVYNNLMYDVFGGNLLAIDAGQVGGSTAKAYYYNNTFQTSIDNSFLATNGTIGKIYDKNNHWIINSTSPLGSVFGTPVASLSSLIQTNVVANGQGFTATNNYSPVAINNSTVGAGTNLTSENIVALDSDLLTIARPLTGPWDIGAYQYVSSTTTSIPGDLNLDHIVNSIDFSLLNSKWFQSYSAYDLYVDGIINALDYAIMSSNWGKTW